MYRDPSEFRERFKAYKDGKSVREIYGLPGYYNGKFSAATKKKIDHYYGKLIANGYDPISAVGILGNAMQESGLDPDSTNSLGYSGLLLNSKAIQQAIINQYGDHSEQSLFRYVSDWTDGSTWIRKGPYAKDTALYSKSYLRKGYKTPEEAAYLFLKRYERAIVVDPKTKKPLLDANGNYIYQDKDKRLKYARDIYNYVTRGQVPLAQLTIRTNKSLSEPIAMQDATRIATTIPQEKTIPIADPRNATIAEALRAMWAHTAFENMPKISDMPIWESPSLPALTPVEYDVTPLKTYSKGKLPEYQDGYILKGHKQIPIDDLGVWARHHDADEDYKTTYWKNVVGSGIDFVEGITNHWRRILNGRGTVDDVVDATIDVATGAAGKVVKDSAKRLIKNTKRAAKKAIKPTKASVKKPTMSAPEVAEYHKKHPSLVKPMTVTPENQKAADFTFARSSRLSKDPLEKVELNMHSAKFPENTNIAAYATPYGTVFDEAYVKEMLKMGIMVPHEYEHLLQLQIKYTPEQASILEQAYPFSSDWLQAHKDFDLLKERGAMNSELAYAIGKKYGFPVGRQFDNIVKKMPNGELEEIASGLSAYNKHSSEQRLARAGAMPDWIPTQPFKPALIEALTKVPATITVPLLAESQLDEYKDGKISINPANRGKFNATKKRTGKTTEELTHSKNPLTRKRAIFALNAKKWHHADGKLPGYENGVFPWGEDDTREKTEQWADDWASRVTTSRVLKEWNKTGVKPKAESSDEYTNRRVKEETKRTWLSDAADISHGIGEAVMAMDPYTAIPYFGAKIGTDVINGNVGMHTALDATAIAGNWLFNYINPNSLLNQNIRTALYNNKIPYSYNLWDIDIPKSFIEGSIQALRGNKIQQLAKPNWFNKSGNILGNTGEASARPLTEMHQNHRAAAWARYLGLDDTLLGVGYIPSRENWVTKTRDPYFENAYREQIYKKLQKGHSSLPSSLLKGTISDKSVYNTAGGMGYEINPSTGVARIFDVWDLLPFKNLNIPILKNFEASQILPGAKPFNFETFVSIPR